MNKLLSLAFAVVLSVTGSMVLAGTLVRMDTSLGPITIELADDKSPSTVENFLIYASEGFYDGTIFHRVIDNFMIQGGGFNQDFQKKPARTPIKNEADNGLKNLRGTIAMARTADPHSATAQFFINVKDNAFLDYKSSDRKGWGYTVFGKVVDGMDVVDKIRQVPTGKGGVGNRFSDVPTTPIIIKNVKVLPGAEESEAANLQSNS
ncbi:MAG: hypothetical protein CSA09_00265 [Candidatus Contendobacter odensis]|uniref:Peptidyl-prolyl cis-trans isomerase n=1 Tax=Candidatus Contendibacter odensensis TaxID=1400860 RepID=A0A2G6PGT4_9GAMM|nr:MAG: hypothetical protein CSA09_00265 [Candidatus Contendobacter odensis]